MQTIRPGAYALVLLVIASGLGLAWGATSVASQSTKNGDVVVAWERMQIDQADVVRIWLRNGAEVALHGSPKIMILNENGGVQQSFTFGQFVIELDPGESVYVDWTLGSTYRCHYGMLDSGGAPSTDRYPCAEPTTGDAGAEPGGGSTCYDCDRALPFRGRFIAVGMFGDQADATVVDLQ